MAKSARSFFLLLFFGAAVLLAPPALSARDTEPSASSLTAKRSDGDGPELVLRSTKKKRAVPRATPAVTPTPPSPAAQPDANGELPLAAWGAIVIDELTGKVLYEKNADAP